jgi:hypothetical protein
VGRHRLLGLPVAHQSNSTSRDDGNSRRAITYQTSKGSSDKVNSKVTIISIATIVLGKVTPTYISMIDSHLDFTE